MANGETSNQVFAEESVRALREVAIRQVGIAQSAVLNCHVEHECCLTHQFGRIDAKGVDKGVGIEWVRNLRAICGCRRPRSSTFFSLARRVLVRVSSSHEM
jgi:hypothetical protein